MDLTDQAVWTHDDGVDFVVSVEPLTSAKARLVMVRPEEPGKVIAFSLISPDEAQALADAVRSACED